MCVVCYVHVHVNLYIGTGKTSLAAHIAVLGHFTFVKVNFINNSYHKHYVLILVW